MPKTSESVKFLINLARTQTIINNRLDRGLGGLGFNEFLILYHLHQTDDQKMRRVDIAEKIGMTASGVTRLLLPMEKIHLIKSGPNEQDARVRCVILTPAGKQKLDEALERIELFAEEIISSEYSKNISDINNFITKIGGAVLMS